MFLISLKALQGVMLKNKVQLKSAASAIQLGLDINYIITEGVLESEVARAEQECISAFRERILNLRELNKWRSLINFLTDHAFCSEEAPVFRPPLRGPDLISRTVVIEENNNLGIGEDDSDEEEYEELKQNEKPIPTMQTPRGEAFSQMYRLNKPPLLPGRRKPMIYETNSITTQQGRNDEDLQLVNDIASSKATKMMGSVLRESVTDKVRSSLNNLFHH